jgi:hypothetical protein
MVILWLGDALKTDGNGLRAFEENYGFRDAFADFIMAFIEQDEAVKALMPEL